MFGALKLLFGGVFVIVLSGFLVFNEDLRDNPRRIGAADIARGLGAALAGLAMVGAALAYIRAQGRNGQDDTLVERPRDHAISQPDNQHLPSNLEVDTERLRSYATSPLMEFEGAEEVRLEDLRRRLPAAPLAPIVLDRVLQGLGDIDQSQFLRDLARLGRTEVLDRLWKGAQSGKDARDRMIYAEGLAYLNEPDGLAVLNSLYRECVLNYDDPQRSASLSRILQDVLTEKLGSPAALALRDRLLPGADHRIIDKVDSDTAGTWGETLKRGFLILSGHRDRVTRVIFSPDGTRLASASDDQTVKIWEVRTGQELLTLPGLHKVTSLAFGPDGRRLAVATGRPEVVVWDTANGHELVTLASKLPTISVAFNPNGSSLATESLDAVKIWDATTGREILTLDHGEDSIVGEPEIIVWLRALRRFERNSLAFNPDGTRLASAFHLGPITVWDTSTGNSVFTLAEGTGKIALSLDGRHLGALGNLYQIHDASTGKSVHIWPDWDAGDYYISEYWPEARVAVSADLYSLAVASPKASAAPKYQDNATGWQIEVWSFNDSFQSSNKVGTLDTLPTGAVTTLTFSRDGQYLAVGSSGGTVSVSPHLGT